MDQLKPGLRGEAELVVEPKHTATHFGSGAIEGDDFGRVLWSIWLGPVEHLLSEGVNSLGVHLDVSHMAATPLGMKVTAKAELVAVDKRKLQFKIWAEDEKELIGEGEHLRVVINAGSFEKRVAEKTAKD